MLCERCDRPRATDEDRDDTKPGEAEHLCWVEWGESCEAVDWRARALAAEALVAMARKVHGPRQSWTIELLGEPVAKARPRFNSHTRKAYTPKKSANWEHDAAWEMRRAWGEKPLRCPVSLTIQAHFARPLRLVHRKHGGSLAASKPMWAQPHVSKPDSDNCIKSVCDALEKSGVVHNDSQFWSVNLTKRYAEFGEAPGVVVLMEWE